jgi:carbamate kinase
MSGISDRPSRVVIALGGNALGDTPEEQAARVREVAPALLGVIERGSEIVITHGNGPQVGMIQRSFSLAHERDASVPAVGLPECVAMSQGYIGYHLQQGLGAAMRKAHKRWHVATVVTQVEVDPGDPAFASPSKPVGRFLTREGADAERAAHPEETFAEDSGRGWRRVVASPEPRKIVEAESILSLLDDGFVVVACGGGGVPVVRDPSDGGAYRGVAAVIDKDMAGELLAEDCRADELVLLTAVDHVAINFGAPDQGDLEDVTADQAEAYADAGQFGRGSMEPKVRAAIRFVRSRPGRVCVIGSLERAGEVVAGESGTRIHG